jgi:hypothetical protein
VRVLTDCECIVCVSRDAACLRTSIIEPINSTTLNAEQVVEIYFLLAATTSHGQREIKSRPYPLCSLPFISPSPCNQ